MTQNIQDTLFRLFESVRHDPDTLLAVPLDGWQEGSTEWRLLESFHGMVEQVQQRILQLRQAEQQLREKEEQYRSIFEATSDAMLIRDLEDGHMVEVNPAACQMYGYSYEEFIGLAANVITHPDSLRLLPGGLQTVRAGHQLQFQGLGLRKDGTAIHVEVRGTPFTYKGKPHLLGVSRDITEQVQAQQLLEQRVEERCVRIPGRA